MGNKSPKTIVLEYSRTKKLPPPEFTIVSYEVSGVHTIIVRLMVLAGIHTEDIPLPKKKKKLQRKFYSFLILIFISKLPFTTCS